ncbi:flavodoxin family protein [Clostridium butyricum]|uniref:flavodoxin family protein n=1 Tax=Clostridium butyricum TaxID=1492 RepID=UPI0003D61FFD|nr:flavodoxin [Clostridium butyricum]ETI90563.1 MAG: Flavodoxin [Clostridium butyricum DORA_1]MDU1005602.1 flavodoxin [Clostridium butyricum]MDU1507192.1 flavodoxin [Clostridium butyricum]MDU4799671.1 flavodoxin [Clostridium butyricum]RQN10565.1 flavodoxin [Clostridium butyricum]
MKNLIIYFSLEGNTKFIAESIAEEIECDIMELIPSKKYSTGKIGKYFWGGKSVMFKEKPELINSQLDISNYKNIIIGTPVWCGTYAPPFNTFLSNFEIKYKNIALFACHGGGGAEKCFDNFKNELTENNFLGDISFVDPIKNQREECSQKAKEWIKSLIR